jgi:hypothetical protein
MTTTGHYVLFRSSFRLSGARGGVESPNIDHAVLDGADRTVCGRRGWETTEDRLDPSMPPACLRCAAALEALAPRVCAACGAPIDYEAFLMCWVHADGEDHGHNVELEERDRGVRSGKGP